MMDWYYDGHGMSAWGWVASTVGTVAVLALLVLGVVLLARSTPRASDGSSLAAAPRSPDQILAERFARGEIDEDEYRQRLATLAGTGQGVSR
jgi:putative membrane protein